MPYIPPNLNVVQPTSQNMVTGDDISKLIDWLNQLRNQTMQPAPASPVPQYPTEFSQGSSVKQPVGTTPMPSPKNDISPIPQDPVVATPETPAASIGEAQPQGPVRQPGNRLSHKEYLSQIRTLRDQMRARGIPEDQLPVPTFTNIQGGPMDVSQGYLMPNQQSGADLPSGYQPPGTEVRSHMTPEYVQGPGGPADIRMGAAHPYTMGEQQLKSRMAGAGDISQIQNKLHPGFPISFAIQTRDEAMELWKQQNPGKEPTAKDVEMVMSQVAQSAADLQRKEISQLKKDFPKTPLATLVNAYETGNWSALMKEDPLNLETLEKVRQDATEVWNKKETDEYSRPLNIDTGEPFGTLQEFINYRVEKYVESVQAMQDALMQMQNEKPAPSKATGKEKPGVAPKVEGGSSVGQPPASALKEGVVTNFRNGQSWTLENGVPKRIK